MLKAGVALYSFLLQLFLLCLHAYKVCGLIKDHVVLKEYCMYIVWNIAFGCLKLILCFTSALADLLLNFPLIGFQKNPQVIQNQF